MRRPFGVLDLPRYPSRSHGTRSGVLPTQQERPYGGADQAEPPGYPDLRSLSALNRAIHDDAGHYGRYSLDERSPLRSALERGLEVYTPAPEGIARTAATLAHGIAQAQAFRDGNRRTAYFATLQFLHESGMGYLMSSPDHMMVRYLNYLVEGQGKVRATRAPVERFEDLLLRRLANRTPPGSR